MINSNKNPVVTHKFEQNNNIEISKFGYLETKMGSSLLFDAQTEISKNPESVQLLTS